MAALHNPPANIKDFERGKNPTDLHQKWHDWLTAQMAPSAVVPAWYDSLNPPSAVAPATKAPPWQGLPRTALLLNQNDVEAAAKAVEAPVDFGSGPDALLVSQPSFLDQNGDTFPGPQYRAQDEYLEWVTLRDPDGAVREVWFTCEGPEYWQLIAENDPDLLVTLYAEVLGVQSGQIDRSKLFFPRTVTHVEPFAGNQKLTFTQGSYNPYNEYNIRGAIHLTQGANTLGAEIALAMAGSSIYGTPPKTMDPDLICCAGYGEPNRFSDPTIGKEVNDLARPPQQMFVTLRDPVGLYIAAIRDTDFTDWTGSPIQNLAQDYFVPLRKSDDGSLILRARFRVPDGVQKGGQQARVSDLNYLGVPIRTGGQIAHAITMHLFAQALPGAPLQQSRRCVAHPCPDPTHPGFVIPTPVGQNCQPPGPNLAAHMATMRAAMRSAVAAPGRPSGRHR